MGIRFKEDNGMSVAEHEVCRHDQLCLSEHEVMQATQIGDLSVGLSHEVEVA